MVLDATLATSGASTGWRGYSSTYGSVAGFPYKRGILCGEIRATATALILSLGSASSLPASILTLGQAFFDRLVVENAGGSPQTFLASAATYQTLASLGFFRGEWSWATASFWTSADDGEVKRATVY